MRLISKIGLAAAAAYSLAKLAKKAGGADVQLRDKVVLITGGSRGLGLALAHEFGKKGCRLALCARDEAELALAIGQLSSAGITAAAYVCDVTDRHHIDSLVNGVTQNLGGIDVLINNAGLIKVGPFEKMEHADFEEAMNLMFWAPVNLTFAFMPHLKKRGGHIINITSIGGRVSMPRLLPYSCAKFALVGFSRGLSAEAYRENVQVMTVVPGLMRTGSYLKAEFKGMAEDEFEWFGLLGNTPGFSVSADYAARTIRKAFEERRSNCVISVPAKLLIACEALAPDWLHSVLAASDSLFLPGASGTQKAQAGETLDSGFGALFHTLTALGRNAAARYNEQ